MNSKKCPYNAWLIWMPTDRCNLSCEYCFTADYIKKASPLSPINIPAAIKTLDETGMIFKIHFSGGGEPLLVPNIIEACVALTNKHYLDFNTNLICDSVKELVRQVTPDRIIMLRATIHIEQLEKHAIVNRFIDHYLLCKEKGINIVAYMVTYPPLLSELQRYRDFFNKRGIEIEFTPYNGTYEGKLYPKSFTAKDIEYLNVYKGEGYVKRFYKRVGICNSGYSVGIILPDGSIIACIQLQERLGDIYKGFEFRKYLIMCPFPKCDCHLNEVDEAIFKKALKGNSSLTRRLVPYLRHYRRELPHLRSRWLNVLTKYSS